MNCKLNYLKIKKEKDEIIITLDTTKFGLQQDLKNEIHLTGDVSLNINRKQDIYINKNIFDIKLLSFEVKTLYQFKDNKNEIIEKINEMMNKHPIKDGKEIIANSYLSLISWLNNAN